MGLTHSQEEDISLPTSSNEIKTSLKQVLHAFRRDIPFFTRYHSATSKTDLSNIQKEEQDEKKNERKIGYHRSRSLDKDHSNEHKPISRSSSSIKWQCQLCQTLNESDSQLCSHRGSSKINVYIPIINHNDKKNDQKQNSSHLDN